MAVQSIPKSAKMSLSVGLGTDPSTGKEIKKKVTYGGLAPDLAASATATKLMAVATDTSTILTGTVAAIETTEVRTLENV